MSRAEVTATGRLAWPIALQGAAQQAMRVTDQVFLGHLGTAELGAGALGTAYANLMCDFLLGFTSALDTLGSHVVGAGDTRSLAVVCVTAAVLVTCLVVPAAAGLLLAQALACGLLGQDSRAAALVGQFCWRLIPGLWPLMWGVVLTKYLQVQNAMMLPSCVSVLTFLLNIALNTLLVGRWGFAGAPLATSCSRALQCCLLAAAAAWHAHSSTSNSSGDGGGSKARTQQSRCGSGCQQLNSGKVEVIGPGDEACMALVQCKWGLGGCRKEWPPSAGRPGSVVAGGQGTLRLRTEDLNAVLQQRGSWTAAGETAKRAAGARGRSMDGPHSRQCPVSGGWFSCGLSSSSRTCAPSLFALTTPPRLKPWAASFTQQVVNGHSVQQNMPLHQHSRTGDQQHIPRRRYSVDERRRHPLMANAAVRTTSSTTTTTTTTSITTNGLTAPLLFADAPKGSANGLVDAAFCTAAATTACGVVGGAATWGRSRLFRPCRPEPLPAGLTASWASLSGACSRSSSYRGSSSSVRNGDACAGTGSRTDDGATAIDGAVSDNSSDDDPIVRMLIKPLPSAAHAKTGTCAIRGGKQQCSQVEQHAGTASCSSSPLLAAPYPSSGCSSSSSSTTSDTSGNTDQRAHGTSRRHDAGPITLGGFAKHEQQQPEGSLPAASVATFYWRYILRASVQPTALLSFLSLGIPGGLALAFESGAFEVATLMAGAVGPTAVAAHSALLSVLTLTYLAGPFALATAGAIRVGNLLGAGQPLGARAAGHVAVAMSAGFMVLTGLVILCTRQQLGLLFSHDPAVVQLVARIALLGALLQVSDGFTGSCQGVMRGCGQQAWTMMYSFVGFWLCGVLLGYLLCFHGGMGMVGLWAGLSTGNTVSALLSLLALSRIRWQREADRAQEQLQSLSAHGRTGAGRQLLDPPAVAGGGGRGYAGGLKRIASGKLQAAAKRQQQQQAAVAHKRRSKAFVEPQQSPQGGRWWGVGRGFWSLLAGWWGGRGALAAVEAGTEGGGRTAGEGELLRAVQLGVRYEV